jgi:hypothetical protein
VALGALGLALAGCDRVFGLDDRDAPTGPACPALFLGARFLEYPTVGSWLAAEAYCESLDPDPSDATYVHLAVLDEAADLVRISGVVSTNELWVGLTDRASAPASPDPAAFVWVTEQPAAPPVWGSGEPDAGGPVRCGYLVGNAGEIHDSTCTSSGSSHAAVCECDAWPFVPARAGL